MNIDPEKAFGDGVDDLEFWRVCEIQFLTDNITYA
jgi:hypothetical protein